MDYVHMRLDGRRGSRDVPPATVPKDTDCGRCRSRALWGAPTKVQTSHQSDAQRLVVRAAARR
eukprot:7388282-Prymnesium_polylepis.1